MKTLKDIIQLSIAILACLVASPALAYTASDLEAITGGTFLNFHTAGETRNSLTISAHVLGAAVEYPPGSGTFVNWSVNDSSDSGFTINGRCIEDNNRRNSPTSTPPIPVGPPYIGASYQPFYVTLSGLTPNATYGLQVVALGRRSDPVSDPGGLLDGLRPDVGINSYDFSYGASAGSLTTVANTAAGTLLWEARASTPININGTDYYYYTGSYASGIGNRIADGSGQLTLYLGEGLVNLYDNGARTMMDGVVVTLIPEPSALALLGLGALALLIRRRK